MSALRAPRSSGKVRAARLTDLAALGELSRLCQSDGAETRSLGLPVNGPPIGVFSLFRLPLGAFRPNDLMFVYEEDGRIAGLVRVEREAVRDEWTIVELDAVGHGQRGRHPLPAGPAAPARGREAGAARFHVACADADGNVELLMQAGFMRYGEEQVLVPGGRPRTCPSRGPTSAPPAAASGRPARSTRCRSPGSTASRRRRRSPGWRPSGSPTGSARERTGAFRARA